MKWVQFIALCLPLACAGRSRVVQRCVTPTPPTWLRKPANGLPVPVRVVPRSVSWAIRPFPQASLSVALPESGTELNAKDLDQVQALVAVGVRVNGYGEPTYVLLVYPISNPLLGASLDQRLFLLPHLLSDLGPQASRRPVDLDGLHGVEFVTGTESSFQRARVFATARHVIALMVKSADANQTTDGDAQLFFDSLQWYDE